MDYRASPNTVTVNSTYYLLHGRETTPPYSDNVKLRVAKESLEKSRRLQNLRTCLKLAYKHIAKANKKAHQKNKILYDRKAKLKAFEVADLVCLYNPAKKPSLTRKFQKPWARPYKKTKKHFYLNYEIINQNNKKKIVHVNRLKKAYISRLWKLKLQQNVVKKTKLRRNI